MGEHREELIFAAIGRGKFVNLQQRLPQRPILPPDLASTAADESGGRGRRVVATSL